MLGCPIRKSWDHRLFAPPPSLSQLITSFIASQSLGIHRSLLFAFFIRLTYTKCTSHLFLLVIILVDIINYVSLNKYLNTSLIGHAQLLVFFTTFYLSFFQYVKDRYLNVLYIYLLFTISFHNES